MSKKLYQSKAPKELWVIFDPLDGEHLFLTEPSAKKQLKAWEKEAETSCDSVWDMTGPFKYELSSTQIIK